jgi:hypothetical protein
MKKFLFTLIGMSTLGMMPLSAAWQLVEDFESGSLTNWGFYTYLPESSYTWMIGPDTVDSSNNVAYASPGLNPDNRVCPQINLPITAADGETITLYFRIMSFGPNKDINFGVTDTPQEVTAEWWSAFESQLFIKNAGTGIGARNGGVVEDWQVTYSHNVWYEYWIVMRNNVGVESDTFDVYMRGGSEFPAQQLMAQAKNFRNGTTDPLTKFMLIAYYGSEAAPVGADPVAFDDIYVAAGEVLSAPGEGNTWAGYDEATSGWYDTMGFLGWVYPVGDWVYVLSLNKYIYLPESQVAAGGAWTYIVK